MNYLTTVPAFLLALAILIVVHEFGHYWVARRCGVKVLRFSVGFGRPLLRRVRGADRTEFVVSAFPLGGYVKMLDENDPDCRPIAPEDLPRAFNRQSVAKRAAIVVAGPVANLLLAIALYWVVSVSGTVEAVPYLGAPPAGTIAATAGVEDGDLVVALDGRPARTWGDLQLALLQRAVEGNRTELRLRSVEGRERTLSLDLREARDAEIDEKWVSDKLGIVRGAGRPVVRGVVPQSVAERAGLAPGDLVLAIDEQPLRTATDLTHRVMDSDGKVQTWRIERDGARLQRELVPAPVLGADGKPLGIDGLPLQPGGKPLRRVGIDLQERQTVRYGPLEAVQRAVRLTWDMSALSLRMVVRMIEGRASLRNLQGPVTVAQIAGQTANIGVVPYLSFLAFISISLGVLNLLPIPLLDGGHLLYYAAEVVKGSPPSLRTVELGQRVGIVVLVLLTALALFNDLTRLFPS
jgi:regulator of sigma E protease